tara:strand:+ start:230 stop:451 length:222 start_codon:yes stop_codon:yes gene_type:complete
MFKGFTSESLVQAHCWFKTDCVEDLVEYRNTIDSKYHYIIDQEIVNRISTFVTEKNVTIHDYVSDPKVTTVSY